MIKLGCSLLYFGMVLAFAGCGVNSLTIQERQLPQLNPTCFEFNASISTVKQAVNQARGERWRDAQNLYERAELAWKGDGDPFARNVFAKPGNENDAYLYGMGNAVGKSQVYLKGGKELPYYADFRIHLVPVSSSRTRVEIFTCDSHVKAGTEWHPFARAGVFVVVHPTSIEEYQILLDIGKQLGAQNMPKLITPDPKLPTKKLRTTRRR